MEERSSSEYRMRSTEELLSGPNSTYFTLSPLERREDIKYNWKSFFQYLGTHSIEGNTQKEERLISDHQQGWAV